MNNAGNPIQGVTDDQIRVALTNLRNKPEFSTVEVIREILGFYHRDVDTPGGSSPNAQFGKHLMKNAHEFGIVRVPPDRTVNDGEGDTTTSAIWRSTP